MQIVLSIFAVFLTVTGAFDYNNFGKKYCHSEKDVKLTASYFPYIVKDNSPGSSYAPFESLNGYVCENFVLTKVDLDNMARNNFRFTNTDSIVVFKKCEIEYFNEVLTSKFPYSNFYYFEDCKISLKTQTQVVSRFGRIFTLGFHNCEITDNLNSKALHKFTSLNFLLFQNCTFQHPQMDNILLEEKIWLIGLAIHDCNIKSFEKGVLSSVKDWMTTITCTSCGLREIDSLFFGTNFDVSNLLSFADNFLTKLPTSLDLLANVEGLEELNLSGNQIAEPVLKRIHFKSLRELETLDLSRNKDIRSIDHKTFIDTNLKKLNMSAVNLKALSKLGKVSLTTIDFSNNKISDINSEVFEGLVNLISLNLTGNGISKLKSSVFKDLKNLTELRLSYNHLSQLPKNVFDTLVRLEVLDLRSNALKNVDSFEKLTSLKELLLRENFLKIIPSGRSLPQSLKSLDLSFNNISKIAGGTFDLLENLNFLNLSHNNIRTTGKNFISRFPQITRVDIHDQVKDNVGDEEKNNISGETIGYVANTTSNNKNKA